MVNMYLAELIKNTSVSFGTSGVRGLVSDFSAEICYGFAQAFVSAVAVDAHPITTVVIGHDLRPSSPTMTAACLQALTDSGLHGVYVGALPTPAIAAFAAQNQLPAIVVTGSHIPYDRNGIKFYSSNGEINKAEETAILNAEISIPNNIVIAELQTAESAALHFYIERYVNFFGINCLSGMRVAIYEHSSVARDLLRQILSLLGAEVISLDRSNHFVPIDTEAVRKEDIARAQSWAKEYQFDAIVSTDGDADRPLIGDEKGNWLRGDVVGILCAKYLNADVVVTPISSNTATEKSNWFSKVIRTRIGSPYVIEVMQQVLVVGARKIMGFEANGGFLLGTSIMRNDNKLEALLTRDAVLPILVLLAMAKESNIHLSELPKQLPQRFTASNRLQNFSVEKSKEVLNFLQSHSSHAFQLISPDSGLVLDMNTLDGLRISFANDDIVHLRLSGNAPELRCYTESNSVDTAQLLCDRVLQKFKQLIEAL